MHRICGLAPHLLLSCATQLEILKYYAGCHNIYLVLRFWTTSQEVEILLEIIVLGGNLYFHKPNGNCDVRVTNLSN